MERMKPTEAAHVSQSENADGVDVPFGMKLVVLTGDVQKLCRESDGQLFELDGVTPYTIRVLEVPETGDGAF